MDSCCASRGICCCRAPLFSWGVEASSLGADPFLLDLSACKAINLSSLKVCDHLVVAWSLESMQQLRSLACENMKIAQTRCIVFMTVDINILKMQMSMNELECSKEEALNTLDACGAEVEAVEVWSRWAEVLLAACLLSMLSVTLLLLCCDLSKTDLSLLKLLINVPCRSSRLGVAILGGSLASKFGNAEGFASAFSSVSCSLTVNSGCCDSSEASVCSSSSSASIYLNKM